MGGTIASIGSAAAALALLFGLVRFGWLRRQDFALAAINAAVALGCLILSGRNLIAAIRYNETPALIFLAIELSVVIAFALLLLNIRVPKFIVITLAVINLVLMAFLALFLLTFRLN